MERVKIFITFFQDLIQSSEESEPSNRDRYPTVLSEGLLQQFSKAKITDFAKLKSAITLLEIKVEQYKALQLVLIGDSFLAPDRTLYIDVRPGILLEGSTTCNHL